MSARALAAGVAFALALTACGSTANKAPLKFSGPTYTANQVTARFAAVTGIQLQSVHYRSGGTGLMPPQAVGQDPQFGFFTIDVLDKPSQLEPEISDGNRPVKPDAQGIYWEYVRGAYPGWSATKVYGNLVLSLSTGNARVLPSAFRNLDRVLRTLGQPVAVAQVGIPRVPTFAGPSFTAQQVAARFHAATGYSLSIQSSPVTWDSLQPSNPEVLDQIYGVFNIDVLHTPETLTTVLNGHPKADREGIYWTYDPHAGGGWTANKVYGNVVLQWSNDNQSRQLTAQFHQLDRILSRLAEPAGATSSGLPDCQTAGIEPAGTKQGTCLQNSVKTIVVDRGGRLALAGYAVTVTGTAAAKTIPGRDGTPPTVAKGQFVIVNARVTNTGHASLDQPVNASLIIPGQTVQASGGAEAQLTPFGVFPLRPGASAVVHFAFDVPSAAVGAARQGGALELPGHPDATPDTDTLVGISRLGG